VHSGGAAQLTFAFRGFLRKDVALERLSPLDGPAIANLKALGSAFFGFHLRHGVSSEIYGRRWRSKIQTALAKPEGHLGMFSQKMEKLLII
jgi:hypothetical protein